MKIKELRLGRISVPLKKPFKTALRTVESVEDVIVELHADSGEVGYGEAPPTGVITGDTTGAIIGAIQDHLSKAVVGLDVENLDEIMARIDASVVHNTSAKAAVDIAVYDLFGKLCGQPLYKLWGGYRKEFATDITISANGAEQMAADAAEAMALGYRTLKIKLGKDPAQDVARMKAIRAAVGYGVDLRVDANQGWKPKEAVRLIRAIEDAGLALELVEQPVAAHDLEGLKHVTDNVSVPVMADESAFSARDAQRIMELRAADIVNIKLMKTGGVHNALRVCSLAEVYGVELMIGCMLEAKVSVTAAVHLAAAKKVITKVDLDGPVLCSEDPVDGGAVFAESLVKPNEAPGLGITAIRGLRYL
ncbi:MAG TPA: dipeptide epimerase [Spirochaetales bacterium]|nr:dipeptide epimerase [Spirochaetales bacterium]HPG85686.1 dipeptide epimerase [Spirochaetales bacterium]HPM72091.1 dipeptide epimerase [Spirochaetales bacterium]